MFLFFKAKPVPGQLDLFAAPVQVHGHTTKQGVYVKPYQATRKKKPAKSPMTEAEARAFAERAVAWWRTMPKSFTRPRTAAIYSHSPIPGHYASAHKIKLSLADFDVIHDAMQAMTAEAIARHDAEQAKAREAAAAAAKAEAAKPEHIKRMEAELAALKGRRFLTASQEDQIELYTRRLAADPAKWRVGHGITYEVSGGGRHKQWNRGFRIVAVHPADRQATVRSVADTGLTTTGGNHDRIEDMRVYLGELRRDKKYDRAAPAAAAPAASGELSDKAKEALALLRLGASFHVNDAWDAKTRSAKRSYKFLERGQKSRPEFGKRVFDELKAAGAVAPRYAKDDAETGSFGLAPALGTVPAPRATYAFLAPR